MPAKCPKTRVVIPAAATPQVVPIVAETVLLEEPLIITMVKTVTKMHKSMVNPTGEYPR